MFIFSKLYEIIYLHRVLWPFYSEHRVFTIQLLSAKHRKREKHVLSELQTKEQIENDLDEALEEIQKHEDDDEDVEEDEKHMILNQDQFGSATLGQQLVCVNGLNIEISDQESIWNRVQPLKRFNFSNKIVI